MSSHLLRRNRPIRHPPNLTSTYQTPNTILAASAEPLHPIPTLRVYLGDRASDLRASHFLTEATFISDNGRSAASYAASPVVKNQDDRFIYFIFSNLRIHASPGQRGTLEFRVYKDGARYGQALRREVQVVNGRDRAEEGGL